MYNRGEYLGSIIALWRLDSRLIMLSSPREVTIA